MEKISISSDAFEYGGTIPAKYTCDGEDISPEVSWDGVPDGTKSLVLIADDPDAPPGTWVHWVLYNIPSDKKGLKEGIPKTNTLNDGSFQGITDFKRTGYGGPCPPPGRPHRYFFKLYAIDAGLDLPVGASKVQIKEAMDGHILGKGELMGKYGR
jgi:Raf kinase inhibitor-like YbhB/YbcL family protein